MNFAKHYNLKDQHALLGASKYQWIRYSDDKIAELYFATKAKEEGTRIHALASELIELGVKLPPNKKTLNMFVNDAIGYRMKSELIVYYSDNAFGTADALVFNEKTNKLRVHDLKTGMTPASMDQLYVYAALFCLEYIKDPYKIDIELRIYQFDDIIIDKPEAADILKYMKKIQHSDEVVSEMKAKEENIW